uniref:BPSL0761 family protein n=1 Tax=Paraburkholderia terrae TaxID=311230 RepID=UPI00296AD9D7|nr:BPSL0761 family protein [Paraburkholderia terrae]
MTTPNERTAAVVATREFLEMLMALDSGASNDVRVAATRLLRHYRLDADIATSSVALPTLWADPRSNRCRTRWS